MSLRDETYSAGVLIRGALRGAAQYRADLALTVLAGLAYQTVALATITVILARFNSIAGWTINGILLLYAIRLTAHGLWVVPFNQLIDLEQLVREGEFDRFLVRPVNPLLQVMTHRIRLSPIGDLTAGLALLAFAMTRVDVDWLSWRLPYLVAAVVGGALMEGGFQLALASIAFRTLGGREARTGVDSVFGLFGAYPAAIFGDIGKWALTVVIPVVFVAYLPTSILLGRAAESHLPVLLAAAAPLAGVLAAFAGYRIWSWQLNGYQASGT